MLSEREQFNQKLSSKTSSLSEIQQSEESKRELLNQLQVELENTKGLAKELMKQNKELIHRLKEMRTTEERLETENREFRSLLSITETSQTDYLNRQLLLSYQKQYHAYAWHSQEDSVTETTMPLGNIINESKVLEQEREKEYDW